MTEVEVCQSIVKSRTLGTDLTVRANLELIIRMSWYDNVTFNGIKTTTKIKPFFLLKAACLNLLKDASLQRKKRGLQGRLSDEYLITCTSKGRALQRSSELGHGSSYTMNDHK